MICWSRRLWSGILFSLPAFLDLPAQLGDRCTDTIPAFEEAPKLKRQLLIDCGGERDQRFRAPPADGAAHVIDLTGDERERIYVIPEALRPLPFLAD